VLNRIDAQRLLTKAAIRPPDLLKSETSAKVAAVIGVDALLMGTLRQIGSAIALELFLREATTGKELYHTQYQEQSSDEFEALFPAATDSAGTIFYFAGLDGISVAECLVCSNPSCTFFPGTRKPRGLCFFPQFSAPMASSTKHEWSEASNPGSIKRPWK